MMLTRFLHWITGPSGDAGDSVSTKLINENSSNVHTFIANETVTWSITGGVDKDKFIINSSTGDLSFQSAPDYENPTDSGNDHSYVVTVRATDQAENTSDQELTITIEDIDDTPPSIEGPSGKSGDLTSTISILENNTVVYTFNANEKVTWSLNGGADSSKFIIDSNSGELNFIPVSTPDYENPSDSDENNSYIVTVRATDTSSYITDQTVTIIVDDVEEIKRDWKKIGNNIDGEAGGDTSGSSVSLSSDGSTVAIGAPGNDSNGSDSGHVRIYQNNDGTWQQIGGRY